jgi:hypothetical protein
MSMWDKLQKELDRVGESAKDVLDEGKLRIELFRVRQLADRAAEALGYAVHRAKRDGKELDAETFAKLDGALAKQEAEARRIEDELARIRAREMGSAEPAAAGADATGAGAAAPPGASTAADGSTSTGA